MRIDCRIEEISFVCGVDCSYVQSGNYAQKLADQLGENKIISCWAEKDGVMKCNVLVRD